MQQEHAALTLFQVLAQVGALIVRLGRIALGEAALLFEALHDMVFAEGVAQLGVGVGALVEADQVLQLIGQHATNFHAHARQVARHHRNSLAARDRQQRAVGHEAQQFGIARHSDHFDVGLAENVATKGLQTLLHAHVDALARFGLILEALHRLVVVLGGHQFEFQWLRFAQLGFAHLGSVPAIWRLIVALRYAGLPFGQHPRLGKAGQLAVAHAAAHIDHQQLLGLVLLVVHQSGRDAVDGQAIEPGYADTGIQRDGDTLAAANTADALADAVLHGALVTRQGQGLRMDPGVQLGLIVGDGELERRIAAIALRQRYANAFFEIHWVDRIIEGHRKNGFLGRSVLRVLIELAVLRLGLKGHRIEAEMVLRHQHMASKGLSRVETDLVVSTNRPVLVRRKTQRVIVNPGPPAPGCRLHDDAGGDWLADQLDRCRRPREVDRERMDADRLCRVIRKRRGFDGEGDARRFHWFRSVLVPLPAKPAAGRQYQGPCEHAGCLRRTTANPPPCCRQPCRCRPAELPHQGA